MSRVALIGENSVEYVSALLDIWNNGDCAVLLDWRIPIETLIKMIKKSGAFSCVIDKKLITQDIDSKAAEISFSYYVSNTVTAVALPERIFECFSANYSNDEAVIIYSSGTTGKSKGIILSFYAINTNADSIQKYMQLRSDDCLYIAKALSHSSTLTGELLVALKTHTKTIIAPTIVPPRKIIDNLIKFNVSTLCLNPTMLEMLAVEYSKSVFADLPLKTIYVSGSVLNNRIYTLAHSTFRRTSIYNVYGLSEAGPRVTAQRAECCASNSVGKPIANVEVKIFTDSTEQSAKIGECGAVHIKTKSMFDGYVVGSVKHQSMCDGWYNTGDIGYFDGNGELHIVGRADDTIIIDSHKVYPAEVEECILMCSDVIECFVLQAEVKGKPVICCLYVSDTESEKEIKRKIKRQLINYEIPRVFIKCESLPRTVGGKIAAGKIKNALEKKLNGEK